MSGVNRSIDHSNSEQSSSDQAQPFSSSKRQKTAENDEGGSGGEDNVPISN